MFNRPKIVYSSSIRLVKHFLTRNKSNRLIIMPLYVKVTQTLGYLNFKSVIIWFVHKASWPNCFFQIPFKTLLCWISPTIKFEPTVSLILSFSTKTEYKTNCTVELYSTTMGNVDNPCFLCICKCISIYLNILK